MIYTTLKQNKENNITYWDIFDYVDTNWRLVADLFPNSTKYENGYDYSDWEKLKEDYTERQIASACLKELKKLTKGKTPSLMIWNGRFIDLDCDGEIAYDQMIELIEDGTITGSNMLREIDEKTKRKGCTIHKGYWYGENNNYYGKHYITYLIDKYFPCHDERGVDYCDNCGNCQ